MSQLIKCECGCIKTKIVRDKGLGDWFAYCTRCNVTTDGYKSKAEAIEVWNKREGESK